MNSPGVYNAMFLTLPKIWVRIHVLCCLQAFRTSAVAFAYVFSKFEGVLLSNV